MANNVEEAIYDQMDKIGRDLSSMGVLERPVNQQIAQGLEITGQLLQQGVIDYNSPVAQRFYNILRRISDNQIRIRRPTARQSIYYFNILALLSAAAAFLHEMYSFGKTVYDTGKNIYKIAQTVNRAANKVINYSDKVGKTIYRYLTSDELLKLYEDYANDLATKNYNGEHFGKGLDELADKVLKDFKENGIDFIKDSAKPKNKKGLEELERKYIKYMLMEEPEIKNIFTNISNPIHINGKEEKQPIPEMHYWGYNYAGPFTHLYDRLALKEGNNKNIPVNALDYFSLIHDIGYIFKDSKMSAFADKDYVNKINNYEKHYKLSLTDKLSYDFAKAFIASGVQYNSIQDSIEKEFYGKIDDDEKFKKYKHLYKEAEKNLRKFIMASNLDYSDPRNVKVEKKQSEKKIIRDSWNAFIGSVNNIYKTAHDEGKSEKISIPLAQSDDIDSIIDYEGLLNIPDEKPSDDIQESAQDKQELSNSNLISESILMTDNQKKDDVPKKTIGYYNNLLERFSDINTQLKKSSKDGYKRRIDRLIKIEEQIKEKELSDLFNEKEKKSFLSEDQLNKLNEDLNKYKYLFWTNVTTLENDLRKSKTGKENKKLFKSIIPRLKNEIGDYPFNAQLINERQPILDRIKKQKEYIENLVISPIRQKEIIKMLDKYGDSLMIFSDPNDLEDDPTPKIVELQGFVDKKDINEKKNDLVEAEITATPPTSIFKEDSTKEIALTSTDPNKLKSDDKAVGFVRVPVDTSSVVKQTVEKAQEGKQYIPEGKNKKPSGAGKLRPTFEMPNEDVVEETPYEEMYDLKFWSLFNVTQLYDYQSQQANTINNELANLENQNNKLIYKDLSFNNYYTQDNNPWDEGSKFRQPKLAFDLPEAQKRVMQRKINQQSYTNKFENSPNMKIPFINQNPPQNIPFKDIYYNEGSTVLNKSIYDDFSLPYAADYHPDDIIKNNALYYGEF